MGFRLMLLSIFPPSILDYIIDFIVNRLYLKVLYAIIYYSNNANYSMPRFEKKQVHRLMWPNPCMVVEIINPKMKTDQNSKYFLPFVPPLWELGLIYDPFKISFPHS